VRFRLHPLLPAPSVLIALAAPTANRINTGAVPHPVVAGSSVGAGEGNEVDSSGMTFGRALVWRSQPGGIDGAIPSNTQLRRVQK
jgi:hypothetical protein